MLQKKIVIIGGGAAGLELATNAGNNLGRKKKAIITLVDKNYNHIWKPLLHEVAAGSLDDTINTLSYFDHASNHHFNFQLGSLTNINRKKKTLQLAQIYDKQGNELIPSRELSYDILVIALGSVSNDFNIPGVKDHCMFLDNQYEAQRFNNKMFNLFLKYSISHHQIKPINIVIVGGGATGVELSAELYNSLKQLKNYKFKILNNNALHITLIEAGNYILPSLPINISNDVYLELNKLGVCILTKTIVINVTNNGLYTKEGKFIPADLMVWAAGIKVPNFMKNIGGLETTILNQLLVKQTLQTTRDPQIFAIGDCAACPKKEGGFIPPRAQSAHQMASHCFNNIKALMNKKILKSYTYKDYGSLISLSSFNTLGTLMGNLIHNNMKVKGKLARFIYLLLYKIHQVSLYGYIKTGLIILTRGINKIFKSRLKIH
ncbi:NADH dehydrogenase [Serratia symbiotica]|nr:NADH dehydrogenase [Serratia symbiotica]